MTVQRRNTRQRQLVLDAVLARCDHPTADDIYLDVRSKDDRVSRGTVYRNLNLLADAGAITSVHVPGGNRFDRRVDCHSHLVCSVCGAIMDAPVPYDADLDRAAVAETGYAAISHNTVFYGVCPACQARRKETGETPESLADPSGSADAQD